MSAGGRRNADLKLATALAAGATRQEAAEASGVSPRTIHRRMQDTAFLALLEHAKRETFERLTGKVATAGDEALQTLIEIHKDQKRPASARVSAARAILTSTVMLKEHLELVATVRELEQALAQLAPKGSER